MTNDRQPPPTIRATPSASRLHSPLSAALAVVLASASLPVSAQQPPVATNATPPPTPSRPSDEVSSSAVQELLRRIQELENREAVRARETQAAQESLVRSLQQRIVDLESKIQSLEHSVVVPELVAPPNPGPSNAELDQQIRIVDRKREIAEEEATERAKSMPQISIGPKGFIARSADTNFVLRVRGLIQADSRTFFDDNTLEDGNSGFLLRRARVGLEGTVFRDFDFQFNAELGDGGLGVSNLQVLDANVSYRFQPDLRLRVGKFKGPVGYEQYLPVSALLFNERSLATDLAPVRDSSSSPTILRREPWLRTACSGAPIPTSSTSKAPSVSSASTT